MRTLVLHSWIGRERLQDEQETDECVGKFIGKYDVVSTMESWERQLKRYWDAEADILILEHDTCPTVEMADSMVKCEHGLCTQAYPLYYATTGLGETVNANRIGNFMQMQWDSLSNPHDFTDAAGFGFAKLGYKSRMLIGNAWECQPPTLDHVISLEAYKKGLKWHQHKELMKHNHHIPNKWIF